jgi:molybdopterin-biosynthesis enzyme MoeA-like protein
VTTEEIHQQHAFLVLIIGDEILSGKRQDKHLPHVIQTLRRRNMQLHSVNYVGDDLEQLTRHLQHSREHEKPVLCFGGIGATPDDNTRCAAALAFSRPLQRHSDAARLIEKQFGDEAYPKRILMADLPAGATLISNPLNNIPGFIVEQHFFFPGFPAMAWPMLDSVLDSRFTNYHKVKSSEKSVRIFEQRESDLIDLMEKLINDHATVKLFSLPHIGEQPYIEIGFRGSLDAVESAYKDLCEALDNNNVVYQRLLLVE